MIDWDRVVELQEEVGAEDFPEIVDVFLEEVEEALPKLTESCSSSDLEDTLHLLKGCAWNLGFRGLGALCAAGEGLAASGLGSKVNLQEIKDIYEASKADFLKGSERRDIALVAA